MLSGSAIIIWTSKILLNKMYNYQMLQAHLSPKEDQVALIGGEGGMGEFEEWLKVCIVFLGLDSQGSPYVDFRIWGCYKSGFSTITLFKILVSVQNSHVRFNVHVQTSLLIAHDCTWLPPFAMTGLRESLVDTCRWCRWWTPASPFSLLAGKSSDCDWGDSHLIWTIKK